MNAETLVVVQIEELKAVQNLESMLEVEGIDVFMIGPADLAASMGYPGEWRYPEVLKIIDRTIEQVFGRS